MINLDNELAEQYLAACRRRLAAIETELLAIEKGGAEIDEERLDRVFRAVHSINEGAGVHGLVKIRELAHRTADVVGLISRREMVATPDRVGVLLRATDRLNELIQNPGASNRADIAEIIAALASLPGQRRAGAEESSASAAGDSAVDRARQGGRHLRVLLVEDDFVSRLLLQTFLSRYGECHIAVNGREAVEAFRSSLGRGQSYDLICMDIMMPEMDGREAVRQLRAMEEAHGVLSTGAKIIMTTAVRDLKEVTGCFHDLCDAYLVKPIDLGELRGQMRSYQLIE
jgi:two-component system chemotaxis response regulator CheY